MPGQNTNAGNGAANNNPTPASSGSSSAPASTGTKNQLEQLNTMREALFSQDGWGYQHVNQDTNWEVSVSPEPQQKDNQSIGNTNTGSTQLWKPNINNGTELWEANLRNGGQPPAQIPVQKTPWGHTPSTNLGGTWGEDDDGTDSSNVWARGPVESAAVGVGSVSNQWGQQHNPNSTASTTNTWTDVREIVQRQNTIELHRPQTNPTNAVPDLQPRNVAGSGDPIRAIMEQREPIRGDPRGISGRLNGTPEMWGQIPQQLQQQHQTQNTLKVQSAGQWAAAPAKSSEKPPTLGSGWEEPSPPPQRRSIPNYDDGTSLWSQQNRWKQQEEARGSHILRSNTNTSNTTSSSGRSQKNDNPVMWGGRNNNSTCNNSGVNQWDGDNDNSTSNPSGNSDWNKQAKLSSNWDEPSSSSVTATTATSGVNWEPKNAQQKVHGLLNMGFKKEDVERALIASNMNFDEALEFLSSANWRRPEPEPTVNYERSYGRVVGSSVPPQFPPSHVQQKYSGFGQQPNTIVAASLNNVGGNNSASSHSQEPTAQQLRMLVQQIQMAVQHGYLSSQILNQPLAPATLVLLNQLLTSIKHLQGAQNSVQRGNNMNSMQLSVTIAKYKQQITSLQSQINAQQAIYIKQQQQQIQQQHQQHVGTNDFIRNHHDALSALQGNFSELNLNKQPGYQAAPSNQQSRLNQWKLPVLDSTDNADFSRAPGATTKTNNTLGIQDGTWSSCRNLSDGWADTTNDNESKDWPTTQASPAPAFTDLVPEFEPGKPWKGSQMKSIEDDPSITPGSVARSPLSINPMPKDAAEIFTTNQTNKNSPTDLPPLSLSSTTWSFNPTNLSNQNFASWSDSSVQQSGAAAELWGAPLNKTSRGPPPGLGSGSKNVAGGLNKAAANGWIGGNRGAGNTGSVSWASTGNSGWSTNSNWLLLKNLNNQIDGSTLCTLCKQHGPLLNFQLYLNQGIALCKYTTREEAQKAQMALNNCVLGSTTISVESPNEADVQNILQHFPLVSSGNNGNNVPTNSGNSGNSNNNRQQVRSVGGPGGPPADSWSANSVWQSSGTSSSSLWTLETNSGGTGNNQNERSTPSNLKSLLPENLLELN